DITFCNPPYSAFVEWATRIIRESASQVVYLVIPIRWQDSIEIKEAIKFRSAAVHTVGEFSFIDAEDRAARAKVHLLRIELDGRDDAFDRFFDEQFADLKAKFEAPPPPPEDSKKEDMLVVGAALPERLVSI